MQKLKKTIQFYDSKSHQKRDFIPIKNHEVKIYVCGPTVYDDAHLGHARSALSFDLLVRVLRACGYEVKYARNFTDIDDKIINKAIKNQQSLDEITQHYIQSYLQDMDALGVQRPDLEPKATQSLKSITALIQKLLDNNKAYQTQNGDIYLEVSQDSQYGCISQRGSEMDTQARIHENEEKRDARDFALWKAYKGENDIGYESSFGFGRPGWHIECSAMIEEHLAYKDEEYAIDIHGGGADLLFPHHENEASQTRCASGREIAKYWLHNGFVTINGEKMSKSLGNSFFIKDALKVYDGEILRNYLIATHYRATLSFSEQDLLAAKKRLDKIYRLKKRVAASLSAPSEGMPPQSDFQTALLEALCDDLNISKALAILESMLNEANQNLDKNPKDKQLKEKIAKDLEFIHSLLGLGRMDALSYFQLGITQEQKAQIQMLLEQRAQAKEQKNYQKADEIRLQLESQGIAILDTPDGSLWERI